MKKLMFIAVIVALLGTGQVFAQTGVYLGLDGGISSQKLSLENVDFDRDTTFMYGFRLGFRVLFFAVEGQYFQASHNLALNEFPDIGWEDRKVGYNYMGLNGKLYLPIPIVAPYLIFGYGYYTTNVKEIDKDRDNSWNAGVGIQLKFHKNFGLSGEGRYHPNTHYQIEEEDVKVSSYTLNVGLNFYF